MMSLQCAEIEDFVYVHPTSALYRQKKDFVVYQHIHQTSRPYMKGRYPVSTTNKCQHHWDASVFQQLASGPGVLVWGYVCTCGQKNLSQIHDPFIFLNTTVCVNFFTILFLAPDMGIKQNWLFLVSLDMVYMSVRIVFIPCCNLITTLFLIKTKFELSAPVILSDHLQVSNVFPFSSSSFLCTVFRGTSWSPNPFDPGFQRPLMSHALPFLL